MSSEWRTANPHARRQPIDKAREAAEALFKPKQSVPSVGTPAAPGDAASSSERHVERQPRIIAIPPVQPPHEQKPAAVADRPESQTATPSRRAPKIPKSNQIPKSEHGRVRALASYGMTLEQVADLYGVSVKRIERIVAATSDDNASAPKPE